MAKLYAFIFFSTHFVHGMNSDLSNFIDQTDDNVQHNFDQYISNFLLPAPQNTTSKSTALQESNDLPPGIVLVLPPAHKQQNTDLGIPTNTSIVFPEILTTLAPNEHLAKIISFVQNGRYAQAVKELSLLEKLSTKDLPALETLAHALYNAEQRSNDQEQNLLNNSLSLSFASLCCIALNNPLYQILATPPETNYLLNSATAYLFYRYCHYEKCSRDLSTLDTYFANVSAVPPMYKLVLPAISMTNEHFSPTPLPASLTLESSNKKEYDGCRVRTQLKQNF